MAAIDGSEDSSSAAPLSEVIHELSNHPEMLRAFQTLRDSKVVSLEGIWPGTVAAVAASLVTAGQDTPWLILLGHVNEAEMVFEELGQLIDRPLLYFPPVSEEVELDSLLQRETTQRNQVLSALYRYHHQDQNASAPIQDLPPVVVSTLVALIGRVPSPAEMLAQGIPLTVGKQIPQNELKSWLITAGYHATTSVQLAGEFASRGGIIDIYAGDMPDPIRVEWFDDEIESIRRFDIGTQRSLESLQSVTLLAAKPTVKSNSTLLDYFPQQLASLLYEPNVILHTTDSFLHRIPFPDRFHPPPELIASLQQRKVVFGYQIAAAGYQGDLLRVPIGDVQRYTAELETLAKDIDKAAAKRPTLLVAVNEGEAKRLQELLADSQTFLNGQVKIAIATLASGFEILPEGKLVLSATQLFRRAMLRRPSKRIQSKAIDSFLDLRDGDLVVHLSHGIGIYRGMTMLDRHGLQQEHLEIEFDEKAKLYVPASKIDLVQRYIGGTKSKPKLARIGSQTWQRQKKAAQRAVQDMAAEYLDLQARRKSQPGVAFEADSVWQAQFDTSFPYQETTDQLSAISATKTDMQTARPMDRLICGDVGFGKTEVAMRAAFKAVDSGYQVAVLVPTTVLAEQHFKTFQERFAEFPFTIAKLSRFATGQEQKQTLAELEAGRVDIVVGTHRLASKDVQFYNLGLIIIDEEQRFGVELKERLKTIRSNVDVLTLSATPIPRTLHMSLIGIRDISNLETPPEDRLSIETRVVRFDDNLIRNAVMRELNRDGQVYFVHNRIQDIHAIASRLQRIAPEARLIIGHGQMPEHQLEKVMIDFIEHRYDILLATTIIESGLDIPNANTIFIDEADRYGLAELHQLRGRVGRYKHQAYCYMLVDRFKHLSPDASRRLHAIEEYSHIGAGFGIAMRDLEIRGAGNLLGTAQSGHIAAIGYELYCQMLENAVRNLTHQAPKITTEVDVDLPVEAFIPSEYVPEMRHKIDLYRRLTRLDDVRQLKDLQLELLDRFGNIPVETQRLFQLAELRVDAAIWMVKSITTEDEYLVLTYTDRSRMEQLARRRKEKLRIVDHQKAYYFTGHTRTEKIDWIAIARKIFE
jgi:transcription-repair coupling factor (superfamily II helicase)